MKNPDRLPPWTWPFLLPGCALEVATRLYLAAFYGCMFAAILWADRHRKRGKP
jgi:hypothetical protein